MTVATRTPTLTVQKTTLAAALAAVTQAVPSKSVLPILEHVLLDVDADGRLTLSATNYELGIQTSIKLDAETPPWRATAPAKLLQQWASSLPGDELALTLNQRWLTIRGSSGSGKLPSLDPDDFPLLETDTATEWAAVAASDLAVGLARTAYAAARDMSRPVLAALLWQAGADGLTLVAADGYRLATARVPIAGVPEQALLIPGPACKALAKLLPDDGSVTMLTRGGQAVFALGQTTLWTRLVDGQFPDYSRIIPTEHKITAVVASGALLGALQAAGLVGSLVDAGRAVILDLAPGERLAVDAVSESGECTLLVDAEVSGEPLRVHVNAAYLADVLSGLDAERVTLRAATPLSPLLLVPAEEEADDRQAVVMPLHQERVDQAAVDARVGRARLG